MGKDYSYLVGQKYGKLTILEVCEVQDKKKRKVFCQCECGSQKHITLTNLTSGKSKSCGCVTSKNIGLDFTGKTYFKLTVIKMLESKIGGQQKALCRCECGNEKTTTIAKLNAGRVKSCGCLIKERASTLTLSHGLSRSRIYITWNNMKNRCRNPKLKEYVNYGGRGITVCDKWLNDFQAFNDWAMANGYSDDLSIDRIDTNGNYEPDNCRFTTAIIQGRNQRVKSTNTSGTKGVSFDNYNGKWSASISVNKKRFHLGLFRNLEDAVKARKEAELKYW